MINEDAERDAYLSWAAFRERMADSSLPVESRSAALWAIDVLAPVLEDAWLRGTDEEGSTPSEILYAESHTAALGELLELGLRLYLLAGVGGMGAIRRELKPDRRLDRRVHTRVVLGAAGLALMKGWAVSLEEGDPPSDVAISVSPDRRIVAEVFVSLTDEPMRSGIERTDDLQHRINSVTRPLGVDLTGRFEGGSPNEEAEWFAALETAAAKAREKNTAVVVDLPAGHVEVFPIWQRIDRGTDGFTGPRMEGKDGRRLESRFRQKAPQAARSGASWLRVDVMDGLWQFTEFAVESLKGRGEYLNSWMHPVLVDTPGLNGAVFSSGPATAQGEFYGESARLTGGGFALRRPLEPGRVRETVIVPTTPTGQLDAYSWLELYDEEGTWLEWALSQVDLPPLAHAFRLA